MFTIIPPSGSKCNKSTTSIGSSKYKNLQISTEYPSIQAQVGQSYYSRVKAYNGPKGHQESTIISCKSSQKSAKHFMVYKSTKPLTVPLETNLYTEIRDQKKKSRSDKLQSETIKAAQTCKNKKSSFSFKETVKVPSVGGKS
jgi:hypothetical protein